MSFIFSASIAAQDYYKKSVEALKKHQLASDTIGKPIRIPYLNLARKDIRVDNRTAQARNIILCCSRNFFFLGPAFPLPMREDGWEIKQLSN